MTGELLVGEGASERMHYVTTGTKPSVTVVKNQGVPLPFSLGGKGYTSTIHVCSSRPSLLMRDVYDLLCFLWHSFFKHAPLGHPVVPGHACFVSTAKMFKGTRLKKKLTKSNIRGLIKRCHTKHQHWDISQLHWNPMWQAHPTQLEGRKQPLAIKMLTEHDRRLESSNSHRQCTGYRGLADSKFHWSLPLLSVWVSSE